MDETARTPIDVNTASADDLIVALPGLDPEIAERIVAHRTATGPFRQLTDLGDVEGIGLGWLEQYGELLTLGQPDDYRSVEIIPTIDTAPAPTAAQAALSAGTHELRLTDETVVKDEALLEPRSGSVAGAALPADEPANLSDEAPSGTTPLGSLEEDLPDLARSMEQSERLEEAMMAEQVVPVAAQVDVAGPAVTSAPAERAPEPTTARSVQAEPQRARLGFGRSALLVALGGLAGALLSLLILGLISGTLNYAPRREYNALNRNVDTMQRNQELTWERVDEAEARAAELERELARLGSLEGRMVTVEASLAAAETALEGVRTELAALSQSVADVSQRAEALDQRMGVAEDGLSALKLSVDELQNGVTALQERVARFDAFFAAVRDLLTDLEGQAVTTGTEG